METRTGFFWNTTIKEGFTYVINSYMQQYAVPQKVDVRKIKKRSLLDFIHDSSSRRQLRNIPKQVKSRWCFTYRTTWNTFSNLSWTTLLAPNVTKSLSGESQVSPFTYQFQRELISTIFYSVLQSQQGTLNIQRMFSFLNRISQNVQNALENACYYHHATIHKYKTWF